MFTDAEYSFSMLKFYYEHTATLLRKSSDDFHDFTERLEREHKERQQPFHKDDWLKHYDVAWARIGDAFPELQIWLVDVDEPSYTKTTWNEWLRG